MAKLVKGFNDLATTHPALAAQADGWDPTTLVAGSKEKKDWRCPEGHPTYPARLQDRTRKNSGCPYCSNQQVLAGFNDLATTHPELALEADGWDPTKVTACHSKPKAWKCLLGHSFPATINLRIRGSDCHYCSGNKVLKGFNDLATTHPELAKEADGWDPTKVTRGHSKPKAWKCSKDKEHKWTTTVKNRALRGSNCPDCAEHGYSKTKPGWFYLLERPGEQQLGVTNYLEERLTFHAKNNWTEVDKPVGPRDGKLVLETEKLFKQWLKAEGVLVTGTHENWFTSKLEVRSLAELKEKSGVETELF